jgi:hypothetical protein
MWVRSDPQDIPGAKKLEQRPRVNEDCSRQPIYLTNRIVLLVANI